MLRRLKLTPRLIAGFGAVLTLALILGIVGVLQLRSSSATYSGVIDHQADAALAAQDGRLALADQALALRVYLAGHDPVQLENYTAARTRFADQLALMRSEATSAADRAAVQRIAQSWTQGTGPAYAKLAQVMKDRAPQGEVEAALTAASTARAALMDQLKGLIDQSRAALAQGSRDASSAASTAQVTMLVILLVALALGMALAILIARSVARPLGRLEQATAKAAEGDLTVAVADEARDEVGALARGLSRMVGATREVVAGVLEQSRDLSRTSAEMAAGAEESGTAVAQIASTVDAVAKGSSDQAASAQAASHAVAEMGHGVHQVAQAGQEAAHAAADADEAAQGGAHTVQEANEAMGRIRTSVGDVSGVVAGLGEKGQEIGQIVGTIGEIAQQTNLLALNAAIEAARAGEQGRGFAVVADEVRKLAESAQAAAGDIAGIIGQIQAETDRAVQAMAHGRQEVDDGSARVTAAGEAFALIRERVARVAGEVQQVAAAAQQLEAGAHQVEEGIASVAAVSQENAASAEEVAASTEQTTATVEELAASAQHLAEQAQALEQMASRFRV